MMDVVHVNEKWFYMTKVNRTYFLADGEEESHIEPAGANGSLKKFIFLAAVARPRFDTPKNGRFDGKIGIWPLTHMLEAQRSSRIRPAGMMVIKPLPNITKEVYRQFICEKVIPAIDEKFATLPQIRTNRDSTGQQQHRRRRFLQRSNHPSSNHSFHSLVHLLLLLLVNSGHRK